MNEEFLHLLPALKSLIIGYFGPDLPNDNNETPLIDQGCCPKYEEAGKSRKVFCKVGLYHEYSESELVRQYPPDLMVAFHAGFAEVETASWRPTLRCIVDGGVPAVFTTYNEQEAREELAVFGRMGACVVKGMEENKWRGQTPRLDCFEGRYDFYYTNYFWYIIRGRR